MSEYRKQIINALLNAENNDEFIDYLYDVISNLNIDVKNSDITVLTNSDEFHFLAKIYPPPGPLIDLTNLCFFNLLKSCSK